MPISLTHLHEDRRLPPCRRLLGYSAGLNVPSSSVEGTFVRIAARPASLGSDVDHGATLRKSELDSNLGRKVEADPFRH